MGYGLAELFAVSTAAAILTTTGCGKPRPDHTARFVDCLQRHGGQLDREGETLRRLDVLDPQIGVGARLQSVSYTTVDVAIAQSQRRRAVVLVEAPHDEVGQTPLPSARVQIATARKHPERHRATVVMPAREDFDGAIEACQEYAAPGEAYP